MAQVKYKGKPSLSGITKELQKPVKVPGIKRSPKIKQAIGLKSYKVRNLKVS